ncbi:hypothetical protein BJY52DRAFT_1190802 [Lactarius psammicola]|nr:hypothetical protein BJY52DRAFT_1190802 [Lactarius psammicola]
MPFKFFSRKQGIRRSRPATPGDQPPAHGTNVVSDPAWQISTHDDVAMGAIQTSLTALREGSSLVAKLPYIAPIAGLLLQALTMRDACLIHTFPPTNREDHCQCRRELCERHSLSEEDLPDSLRAILGSLQRELDKIERLLKKCSRRKGIKGVLLRKDPLTKTKQCDVELSNVLQAFQAELLLDVRVALIAVRPEAASDSGPIEVIPAIPQEPNAAQMSWGTNGALGAPWLITLNAKELIIRPSQGPDLLPNIMRSRAKLHSIYFLILLELFP